MSAQVEEANIMAEEITYLSPDRPQAEKYFPLQVPLEFVCSSGKWSLFNNASSQIMGQIGQQAIFLLLSWCSIKSIVNTY